MITEHSHGQEQRHGSFIASLVVPFLMFVTIYSHIEMHFLINILFHPQEGSISGIRIAEWNSKITHT